MRDMFDFHWIIKQSEAKMFSFLSKRKAGRQEGELYKVPTVPFYEKAVRQRLDEQKGNCSGHHPGDSFKT